MANEMKPLVAQIIAVGSELLTPHRSDTNSLWLTQKLNDIGVEVKGKAVVGDESDRIVDCLRGAVSRADVIVVTGGLGPTEDDLTRDAVARLLNRGLIRHEEILERLRQRFSRYGFKMTANNERQADIIDGAEPLENTRGSAPGQFIESDGKLIFLLPGPPGEMRSMYEQEVFPRLAQRSQAFHIGRRELKVSGLTESAMDDLIAPIYKPYTEATTTILSAPTGLEVHISARAATREEAQQKVDVLSGQIEDRLGAHVFSREGELLEVVVGKLLAARKLSVALAESCTGGLIAKRMTDIPGSSRYFLTGVVAYSNEAKVRLLGVPEDLITAHGAVSPQVAEAMAVGVRDRAGADVGLSVTGIAGPEGGTPEKPVGLVFIGLAVGGRLDHKKVQIPGDRDRVRELTAQLALDWLRRRLQDG